MEQQEKTVLIFHKREKEYDYPDMDITFLKTYPLKVKNCDDEKLKKIMSKSFKIAHPTWEIVKVTVE